jgi:hypothetical protein
MPVINFRHHPQLLHPEGSHLSSLDSVKCTLKEPQQTERRRVQFKDTVSVRPIVHVDNMSDKDISGIWFCKRDFEKMKKSFGSTLRMIAFGEYEGDCDEHCVRGLEFRSRAGALRRRENKWNALNAVFDEQDRQREMDICNDELLSEVYMEENYHCRQSALKLGARDEDAARFLQYADNDVDKDMDASEDCWDIYNKESLVSAPPPRRITISDHQRE